MKIGILTFFCAHNYGAVLQCYALQEKIKGLGHDVEVINYTPEYLLTPYRVIPRYRLCFRKPIKLIRVLFYEFTQAIPRWCKFNKFIKEHINVSPLKITTSNEIEKYDVVVIGSDQVWNKRITGRLDRVFWGDSISKKTKIISYSASMGGSDIEFQDSKIIHGFLKRFSAISVREANLAEALKPLTSLEIPVTSDPTLIHDKQFWNQIAISPKVKEKYILIYQVVKTTRSKEFAEEIAKQLGGIKIYSIAAYPYSNENEKDAIKKASPAEFIGWIKNAECVITTSFHGTVFSTIFNRPFYTIDLNSWVTERNKDFLGKTNLLNRLVVGDTKVKFTVPNFEMANEKIEELRKESSNYLNYSL